MSLSANNIKITSLKDELELCANYLSMQKIRFGDTLNYTVSVPDETLKNTFVPSFSIQPLLENAIKHNELTKASPLHISIENIGDRIKVANNKKSKTTSEPSSGIGLANLAERYRILSGDEIIIEDDGSNFSVSIKLFDKQL
jgi:sensor histidine kinase YesM